jgi:hypothetical protein
MKPGKQGESHGILIFDREPGDIILVPGNHLNAITVGASANMPITVLNFFKANCDLSTECELCVNISELCVNINL